LDRFNVEFSNLLESANKSQVKNVLRKLS
jgi:hypothetical protein